MSENKEANNNPDLAETIADIESPPLPEKEQANSKKSSNKLPIFLLFVAMLTAGYIFAPQPLKNDLLNTITPLLQFEQETPAKTQEEVTTPVVEDEPPVSEPEAVAEIASPPAEPEVIAASSDDVNRMLTAMEGLQQELKALRQEQRSIQDNQRALEKMQLRTRLRWITNSANHLPQLHLAWEEISLMPSLSGSERATTSQMLTLAQQRLQELRNWQQTLQTHAESLATPEHENIIPEYESPWLSWVRDYFTIKAASTIEQQQDEQLRQQLLNTARNVELEQWPEKKTWLQLRAQLQLKLASSADASEPAELGLPESFEPLKSDIELLRNTAASWLEALS